MRPPDNRFRPRYCQGDHLAAVARNATNALGDRLASAEVHPSLDGGYLIALDRADLDALTRHMEETR